MNIWDLEIGEIGVTEDGVEYEVIKDSKRFFPTLGRMPYRICRDVKTGKIQHFLRGIDVTRKMSATGGS